MLTCMNIFFGKCTFLKRVDVESVVLKSLFSGFYTLKSEIAKSRRNG